MLSLGRNLSNTHTWGNLRKGLSSGIFAHAYFVLSSTKGVFHLCAKPSDLRGHSLQDLSGKPVESDGTQAETYRMRRITNALGAQHLELRPPWYKGSPPVYGGSLLPCYNCLLPASVMGQGRGAVAKIFHHEGGACCHC